ncbi:hypothetical protein [Bartonella rattaustraliani]|nr:hypothetical protein [Bartonella rattaustraliani]
MKLAKPYAPFLLSSRTHRIEEVINGVTNESPRVVSNEVENHFHA